MARGTGQLPAQSMLNERYLILEVVGRGGMGCVYRALDTWMENRMVAIKEMSRRHSTPEELQIVEQCFAQEAVILHNLTLTPHPHLPKFYEAFSQGVGDERRSYLVMDFIEGKTLEKILREAPAHRLDLATTLHYAAQLCDVLSFLHQQPAPVIFRDLKPSNMIITADDVVYLIDFGIARHFKPGQAGDTGHFFSNGFGAPELLDEVQTDPRSDIFSLGAILHSCLTGDDHGRKAFRNFTYAPIGERNSQVPPQLENLIMQMLAIKPEQRPASAAQVQILLRQVMQSGASLTTPVQPLPARMDWADFNAPQVLVAVANRTLSVFLSFCHWFGLQVQALPSRWQALRQNLRNWRRARAAAPPRLSPVADRAQRILGQVMQIQLPLSLADTADGSLHLWTLFAVLCFAFFSSLYMISWQHMSPWLVLFLAGFCLVCVSFIAATRRALDRVTQAILAVAVLAVLLLCLLLLPLPVIATFIQSITTAQVIAIGLLFLGVASLLRPFEQNSWRLDHAIASVGLGLCAFLQGVLGSQELAWLPAANALTVNWLAIAILVVFALVELFRMKEPYANLDRAFALPAGICYIAQLIAFGGQALQPFAPGTPWPTMTLNVVLVVAIILLEILSFYFNSGAWIILARLSLTLLMLVSAAMLLFVSANLAAFSLSPALDFLAANYFDPIHLHQFLINSMIAAGGVSAFVLLRRASFLLVDLLLVIAIALLTFPLQNAFAPGLAPSYLLAIRSIVLPLTNLFIALSLPLFVVSALSLFLPENDLSRKIVTSIDRIILLLGRALLCMSALSCLAFLWEFGYNEGVTTGVFSQLSARLFLFIPIGAAFLGAAFCMLYAGHHLLYSLSPAGRNGSGTGGYRRRRENEKPTFFYVDRLVMVIVTVYLALFVGAMPEEFPAPVANLRSIEPPGPFVLWFVLAGLVIAGSGMLGWLPRSARQQRDGQRVLASLFLTVSGCLLIAAGSLVFALMRPLFVYTLLMAVVLLIPGLLLATWRQGKAHLISS